VIEFVFSVQNVNAEPPTVDLWWSTSRTDENGQVVHWERYVSKICAATELLTDRASTSDPTNRRSILHPCKVKMPADCEPLRPAETRTSRTLFR
jgi:hypothetical protein